MLPFMRPAEPTSSSKGSQTSGYGPLPNGAEVAPESIWLLGELAGELSRTQTLDQFQMLLSRRLRWVINFERCTLAIWHHPMDPTYELRELTHPHQARVAGSQLLRFGEDLLSNVLQTARPRLGDPKLGQDWGPEPGLIDRAQSVLMLPLRTGSQTIGSLNFSSSQAHYYPIGIRNVVSLLASQVAGHLGFLLAHRQTRASLAQQSTVAELGQRALAGLDPDQLMQAAVQQVALHLQVKSCQIWVGPDPEALTIQSDWGWWPQLQALTLRLSDLSQGILPPALQALGIRSGMGIPFHAADGVSRILAVHDTELRHFDRDSVAFLSAVVHTLDAALLRTRAETHRLKAEHTAQLQAQMREMERLNHLRDQFVSSVSHELRTPLTSIKLSIQMLQSTALTPQQARYVHILQQESQREIRLVEDLLALQDTKPEVNLPEVNLPEVDLPEVNLTLSLSLQPWLEALMATLQPQAQHRGQSLQLDPIDPALSLITDPDVLGQVLEELLTNAIKFTPSTGWIQIRANAVGSELVIQVQNAGNRIPDAERERIFERFYRLPQQDPWAAGGTGLGLPLAQRRTQALKGRLQLLPVDPDSQTNCFELRIPLDPNIDPKADPNAIQAPAPQADPPPKPSPPELGLPSTQTQSAPTGSDGWEDGWADLEIPKKRRKKGKKRG